MLEVTCLRKVQQCHMRQGLQEVVVSFATSSDTVRKKKTRLPGIWLYKIFCYMIYKYFICKSRNRELLHYPA